MQKLISLFIFMITIVAPLRGMDDSWVTVAKKKPVKRMVKPIDQHAVGPQRPIQRDRNLQPQVQHERKHALWEPQHSPNRKKQDRVFMNYRHHLNPDQEYSDQHIRMVGRCQYPEHVAAFHDDLHELRSLLMSNMEHLDTPDINGYTPLALAATWGRPEAVQELVTQGADVSAVSFHCNRSILHSMVRNSQHAPAHGNSKEEIRKGLQSRPSDEELIVVLRILQSSDQHVLRTDLKDSYGRTAIEWARDMAPDTDLLKALESLDQKK